eukprot:9897747-Ditylum_brightwellii.AAC.1
MSSAKVEEERVDEVTRETGEEENDAPMEAREGEASASEKADEEENAVAQNDRILIEDGRADEGTQHR